MQGKDNFDKDMAIFIISSSGIPRKLVLDFIENYLSILNKEQTSSAMFLINKHQLATLYYPLLNHLKLNSFYNSESFKKRLTYSGILFDKEEGYKEFQEALEHDLSITTLEEGNIELDTGNILFLFVANKNYEKIHKIFLRYLNQKTKRF